MLTRRVIPCLDVKDGRLVKGVQFGELRDAGDPAEAAEAYDIAGADELVFLDISATPEGRQTFRDLVRGVADCLFIPLTVGGGVSELAHFEALLEAGADRVAVNTGAVQDPELISAAARRFGSPCVVAAVDVRWAGNGWRVHTHGGFQHTRLDVVDWCRQLAERGAGELLLTSMDRDGTQAGYDCDLIHLVSTEVGMPVIACGGAGRLGDFVDAVDAGASAVLAASLFHFRTLTVREVKEALENAGHTVRTTW